MEVKWQNNSAPVRGEQTVSFEDFYFSPWAGMKGMWDEVGGFVGYHVAARGVFGWWVFGVVGIGPPLRAEGRDVVETRASR